MAIYESLQFYKTLQVTTLLDIAFGILPLAIFVWFFRRIRWIFLSVVAVESWFNLTNYSEVNSAKHLSKYLFLSMMTTSLPLSCFIVTIFWLFDKFLIFSLCLYGTKNFSKNPKYDRYQGVLHQLCMIVLIKDPLQFQINLLLIVLLKMKICQTSIFGFSLHT